MCFSATASFVSGAALIGVGLAASRKARGTEFASLATIPQLFGLQQILEGFLWLGLRYEPFESFVDLSAYGFLIFAWLIWPLYVSFSIRKAEPKGIRRALLLATQVIGGIVALALFYVLLFKRIEPEILGHSIRYNIYYDSSLSGLLTVFYLLSTVFPAFVSSRRYTWVLGVVTGILYVVSMHYYKLHFLSVWCFFAALGSVVVLWVIHENTRNTQ